MRPIEKLGWGSLFLFVLAGLALNEWNLNRARRNHSAWAVREDCARVRWAYACMTADECDRLDRYKGFVI